MELVARDLMVTNYDAVQPDVPLTDAIRQMRNSRISADEGRRVFGLMVIDDQEKLAGMLSMFDVLYFLDASMHMGGSGEQGEELEEIFEQACNAATSRSVGDTMARTVISVDEFATITDIIDLMIKNHLRRIPVCSGEKTLGIIYISDIFYEIYMHLL